MKEESNTEYDLEKITRPVQYFSDEYIERCKELSTEEILQFIDDFQKLHLQNCLSNNVKIEPSFLYNFKTKNT